LDIVDPPLFRDLYLRTFQFEENALVKNALISPLVAFFSTAAFPKASALAAKRQKTKT